MQPKKMHHWNRYTERGWSLTPEAEIFQGKGLGISQEKENREQWIMEATKRRMSPSCRWLRHQLLLHHSCKWKRGVEQRDADKNWSERYASNFMITKDKKSNGNKGLFIAKTMTTWLTSCCCWCVFHVLVFFAFVSPVIDQWTHSMILNAAWDSMVLRQNDTRRSKSWIPVVFPWQSLTTSSESKGLLAVQLQEIPILTFVTLNTLLKTLLHVNKTSAKSLELQQNYWSGWSTSSVSSFTLKKNGERFHCEIMTPKMRR